MRHRLSQEGQIHDRVVQLAAAAQDLSNRMSLSPAPPARRAASPPPAPSASEVEEEKEEEAPVPASRAGTRAGPAGAKLRARAPPAASSDKTPATPPRVSQGGMVTPQHRVAFMPKVWGYFP